MSKRRFDTITRELRFTDGEPPIYVDKFWQVRQMINVWNRNMAAIFFAAWVICLDESGAVDGLAQVGSSVPKSPTLLGMNTILHAVASWA